MRKLKSLNRYAPRKRRSVLKNRISVNFRNKLVRTLTPSEEKFKVLLSEIKRKYHISISFQKRWVTMSEMYISDFYFPLSQITIEIDGGCHNDPERKRRDLMKEGFLLLKGIKTYRIQNEQVDTLSYNQLEQYLLHIGVIATA